MWDYKTQAPLAALLRVVAFVIYNLACRDTLQRRAPRILLPGMQREDRPLFLFVTVLFITVESFRVIGVD